MSDYPGTAFTQTAELQQIHTMVPSEISFKIPKHRLDQVCPRVHYASLSDV